MPKGPTEDQIEEWGRVISKHLEQLGAEESEFDGDTAVAYVEQTARVLESIARKIAPRDTWGFFCSGGEVMARSEKLSLDFRFGFPYLDGFYLSMSLYPAQHLSGMPNGFWRSVVELEDFGVPELELNCIDSKGKGLVYQIVRAFVDTEMNGNESDAPFMDFGQLTVVWKESLTTTELARRLQEVFSRFYRIAYLLYRAEYITQKSREKKSNI